MTRILIACLPLMAAASLAGCGAMSNIMSSASSSTTVKSVWKDPKYTAAPMKKLFVISMMKMEPGGRDAVEDAIVAQLQRAGIEAQASHTVISSDPTQQQPALMDVIKRWGADGVLMAQVKWISADEPYTIGGTLNSPAPDMLGFSDFLAGEGANQPGDYKVARISTSIFQGSLGKQVWTAYTDSYNAGNLARVIPDYTAKVVTALAQDRIIAATAAKF